MISCRESIEDDSSITASDKEVISHQTENLTVFKIKNQTLSNELVNFFNSSVSLKSMGVSLGIKDMNYLNFDFKNISKTKIKGIEGDIFVINYKSNSGSEDNFSFVVFRNINNDFINPMLIKSVQGKSIEYGLINTGQILSVENSDKIVSLSITTAYSNKNAKISDCGNAVMSCVQDAYSGHGWASVYIFLQTAFIPETAAGIVYYCGLKNCNWR